MTKQQRKMGACSRKCTGKGRSRSACLRSCLRGGAKKTSSKRRRSR